MTNQTRRKGDKKRVAYKETDRRRWQGFGRCAEVDAIRKKDKRSERQASRRFCQESTRA